jgi:uncharacterized protein YndB with AHSA1/START domain
MSSSKFVYVTYIRTTPDKLWEALTKPEFARRYWFGYCLESDWRKGSPWRMVAGDGTVPDAGEVVEIDRPRLLVLSWRHETGEMRSEGYSRARFELEVNGEATKLTVVHEMDVDSSKLINAVSGGWPMILANLKTLLETGKVLDITKTPKCEAA